MSSKITIDKSTAYINLSRYLPAFVGTCLGAAYFVGKQSNQTVK